MALARMCDICGKHYAIYNTRQSSEKHNAIRFLNIDKRDAYFESSPIDCCPECMESIKVHINKLSAEKEKNNAEN